MCGSWDPIGVREQADTGSEGRGHRLDSMPAQGVDWVDVGPHVSLGVRSDSAGEASWAQGR